MYSEADKMAAWLILQLAEQGRPEEIHAQMIASLISVGGGNPFEEYAFMLGKISKRVGELLDDDDAEIWHHLLPGGHQGDPLPWVIQDNRDLAKVEVQIVAVYASGWIVLDKNNNLWLFEELHLINDEAKPGQIIKVLREDLIAANYKDIQDVMRNR